MADARSRAGRAVGSTATPQGPPAQRRPPGQAPRPDDGQEAWTAAELDEVRGELAAQASHLRGEIDHAESASAAAHQASSGEGSGDEADAGSKTFEREHQLSLAKNSRDLLQQVERALSRLESGTYGHCERCEGAIPKPRLQAAPRATLCVRCKQREERR